MMQKVTLNSYFPFTRFNLGYEAVVELVIPLCPWLVLTAQKKSQTKDIARILSNDCPCLADSCFLFVTRKAALRKYCRTGGIQKRCFVP